MTTNPGSSVHDRIQIRKWADECAAQDADDFAAGSLLQGRVMQEVPKKPHPVETRRQVTRRAIRDFIGLLVILATVGWLFWEWVQPGTWLR